LADRIGPRLTLTLAVVWWGIFTTLSASIPSTFGHALLALILMRFLLGVGEAVVYPASNRVVAEWIPSRERGIANGLIFAGVGAGAGITPPLIVYVMESYGWRWSFVVSAILGLAAGAVWWFIARDKPSEHRSTNAAERKLIQTGLPQAAAKGAKGEAGVVPLSRMLRSSDLWAMTLAYFAYGYSAYMFFTWFFNYLNAVRGLDLKSSRFYAMLPFIAMAVCSLLGATSAIGSPRRGVRVSGAAESRCSESRSLPSSWRWARRWRARNWRACFWPAARERCICRKVRFGQLRRKLRDHPPALYRAS
jgi:MFS transporter, ACS family, glucarate transporter